MLFGALKTKGCLSEASSFYLAEKSTGVGKKMQTANFLFASFFFCSGKRKMMSKHKQNDEKTQAKMMSIHKQKYKKKEGYLSQTPNLH